MAFHDTVKTMRELLVGLSIDLEKAVGGNKAASQRVRTGTIKLEKSAKKYRKESIIAEKASVGKKKAPKKAAPKKAVKVVKPAKVVKVKAKAKKKVVSWNPCSSMKKCTAKIPMKKR